MKKIVIAMVLIGITSTFFMGCSSKPTTEEALQAVEEGKLTIKDAIDKGYLSEDDLKESGHIIDSFDKVESAPKLNAFTTTDTNGKEVTQAIFEEGDHGVYVVFWDADNEDSITEIKELNAIYDTAVEKKYNIVGVVIDRNQDENVKEIAKDLKFKNIFLNDEMKATLGGALSMIENVPIAVYSNANGDLVSAWSGGITDKEKIVTFWDKASNFNDFGK